MSVKVDKKQEEQRLWRPFRQGMGMVSNENEENALVEYIRQNIIGNVVKVRIVTLFSGSLKRLLKLT